MAVVDAHHHLWDPGVREYPFLADASLASIRRPFEPEDLRDRCRTSGVGQTVLVQTVPSVEETREFLREAEHSDGLIAGVVGWVDLQDPGISDTIDALREGPGGSHLVGVRHQAQDEPDPGWLARPRVIDGLRRLAEADLRFDLLVTSAQLTAAVEAVRAVPEGRFVLNHIAKPSLDRSDHSAWREGITALAQLPNASCKLSGLVSLGAGGAATAEQLRPWIDRVLTEFGPERLMFGSDWPVSEAAESYKGVLHLAEDLTRSLSDAERGRIFAATAREFYGLPQPR